MNTCVEFKSSAFPKYENEDEETVNPNRWGKRLAEFVRDNLPSYGVATEDILCEDWGWLINTKNDDFPVWIGCGPMDDFSEFDEDETEEKQRSSKPDYDGPQATEFCIFVTAEPSFFKKLFKKVDTAPAVSKVVSALEKMVAEREEFRDAEWSE